MIEKILDKYYTKKVVEQLLDNLLFFYRLDYRLCWKNNKVLIKVKKREHKKEYYKEIFYIPYSDALFYFTHIEDVIKGFKENVKLYLEGGVKNDNKRI